MTPEFESCSLLLLYWGMLFTFSLRLLSKSELAVKSPAPDEPSDGAKTANDWEKLALPAPAAALKEAIN